MTVLGYELPKVISGPTWRKRHGRVRHRRKERDGKLIVWSLCCRVADAEWVFDGLDLKPACKECERVYALIEKAKASQ